jgi:type IV pilus assembly protein PilE
MIQAAAGTRPGQSGASTGGRPRARAGYGRLLARGFTLIELLVVVAIVAILAKWAISSYASSVTQARRTDAKSGLLDLAAREERFYTVNNSYTTSGTALGYANTFPVNLPVTSNATTDYVLQTPVVTAANVATSTPAGFSIQAVPTGPQANDSVCGEYQLDNFGNQTNSPAQNGSFTSVANCW